eukprot:IDg1898t1
MSLFGCNYPDSMNQILSEFNGSELAPFQLANGFRVPQGFTQLRQCSFSFTVAHQCAVLRKAFDTAAHERPTLRALRAGLISFQLPAAVPRLAPFCWPPLAIVCTRLALSLAALGA